MASPIAGGPATAPRLPVALLQQRVSPITALAAVLLLALALRLVFAAATGLGNDESYTLVASRTLALSYFDHPPMAWWLAHLASRLGGSEAPLLVRTPFLLLSTASTLLMYLLTARLFGRWAGVWAALMMACAPVLGLTGAAWVLPDGPLVAFLLAGALVLTHVLFDRGARPAGWLLAGFLGGLAMLSKYHGVFFLAGTLLFLLVSPRHRHWLASPWPYAGAAVALAMFTPVIVWNVQHQFASLAFQGSRATGAHLQLLMPLVSVAGIAVFLTPWIWAGLAAAAWRALRGRPANPRALLLLCLAAGPVLVFPMVAAWSSAKPFFHWAAPGYLMLFPLLGRAMARRWPIARGVRIWTVWAAGFTAAGVAVVAVLSLVPAPVAAITGTDPLRELAAWSDLKAAFQRHSLTPERYAFVTAPVWHEAGKVGYALGPAWPIACMGADCRGFLIADVQRGHEGADAVLVLDAGSAGEIADMGRRFRSLEPVETLELRHSGALVGRVAVLVGRGYRDPSRAQ
ncbi:glycosyltransferase family 39 protein [Xanthobacter sp. V3C-3]|uniref:glycosyltransferase family 39 protein n=1 Tax=Xanthobacter lutulentifluminis TaxID=3119935 RepID=UPI003729437E